MNPGIYTIPRSTYDADPCQEPSLSHSLMKVMLAKSPAHARRLHPRLNPKYQRQEDGKFDLGTAAHSLLLEGYDCCSVVDADTWQTKAAKEARERIRASGLIPMLTSQYERACMMAEIARDYVSKSVMGNLLSYGKPEQTVIWQDGGTWCRSRLDFLTEDRSIILDYKSTSVSNPGVFVRSQFASMGYHTQDAFYSRGIKKVTGIDSEFWFLVQEDEEPYSCYLVRSAPSLAAVAESRVERGIKLWRACLRSDEWPAYSQHAYEAEATAWQIADEVVHEDGDA